MKFFQKIIFSSFVFSALVQLSVSQSCPTQCLHDGIPDLGSCSCVCFQPYEGTYCERAKGNCTTGQPSDCGTNLPSTFCDFRSVKLYCPAMCNSPVCTCGYDECLNGGIFDSSTCTCLCPDDYYGTVCENFSTCTDILTCENFASFNPNTCVCDCLNGNYAGTRCESLACTLPDSSQCSQYTTTECVVGSFVYSLCPRLCSRCGTTTVSTTTVSTTTVSTTTVSTTTVSTASTSTASTSTASASTASTSTASASTASTSTASTSTASASTASASTASTSTASASTASTSTASTTLVTSCQPLSCSNGFVFNTATCACNCGTGFSGSLCETYNCATTPIPDASLGGVCDALTCDGGAVNGQCPFKCLCGGSTANP